MYELGTESNDKFSVSVSNVRACRLYSGAKEFCCICNMGRKIALQKSALLLPMGKKIKILKFFPFQLHGKRVLFALPRLFAYLIILLVVCSKWSFVLAPVSLVCVVCVYV